MHAPSIVSKNLRMLAFRSNILKGNIHCLDPEKDRTIVDFSFFNKMATEVICPGSHFYNQIWTWNKLQYKLHLSNLKSHFFARGLHF